MKTNIVVLGIMLGMIVGAQSRAGTDLTVSGSAALKIITALKNAGVEVTSYTKHARIIADRISCHAHVPQLNENDAACVILGDNREDWVSPGKAIQGTLSLKIVDAFREATPQALHSVNELSHKSGLYLGQVICGWNLPESNTPNAASCGFKDIAE